MSELMKIRRSKGLSQRALAKSSGVSPSSIYEVENGRRRANPSTLRKLADALEVEVVDLLEVQERPKAPRLLSAEWALQVPDEVFEREIKAADVDRLRKLVSELAGDNFTRTRDDLKAASEGKGQRQRRIKSLSLALRVSDELVERGEEAPEKGLPALKKYRDAVG